MELTGTEAASGSGLVVNRVHFPVTALGPGRRLGVWVQGCSIGCAGCLARDTWAAGAGSRLPPEVFREVWRRALALGAEGLTVSGGEPGDQPEALTALLRVAREEAVGRPADLLVYTGHPLAELARRAPEVTGGLADAVIGEPYRADAPTTLIWRGSANQTLTPLTALGRERYGPWREHRPARAPMQLVASDRDAWLIGVPRAGELAALERSLRTAGFRQGQVSWRPARPDAPSAGPYARPPTIPSGTVETPGTVDTSGTGETSGDKESDR